MKKKSSKDHMDKRLDLLEEIIMVEPSDQLFVKIEQKIEDNRKDIIPLNWLKVAVILFVGMISVETYLLTDQEKDQLQLEELTVSIDNTLYNE